MNIVYVWNAAEGALYEDGVRVAEGYAGAGEGRNNPAFENQRNIGPPPRGVYFLGDAYWSLKLGPVVIPLTQMTGETYGRAGFLIHGDNYEHDASRGCIVLNRLARNLIAARKRLRPSCYLRVE